MAVADGVLGMVRTVASDAADDRVATNVAMA